jgi:hypothetical protein
MLRTTDVHAVLKDAENRLRDAARGKGGKVRKRRRHLYRVMEQLHLSPATIRHSVAMLLAEERERMRRLDENASQPDRRRKPQFVNRRTYRPAVGFAAA